MIIDNLTTSLSTLGVTDTILSGITESISEENAHESVLSTNLLTTSISATASTATCLPNSDNNTTKNVRLTEEYINTYSDTEQDELASLIDTKLDQLDKETKPLSLVRKL